MSLCALYPRPLVPILSGSHTHSGFRPKWLNHYTSLSCSSYTHLLLHTYTLIHIHLYGCYGYYCLSSSSFIWWCQISASSIFIALAQLCMFITQLVNYKKFVPKMQSFNKYLVMVVTLIQQRVLTRLVLNSSCVVTPHISEHL